jgi:Fe-S cluster assembly iron-binding protein IscA
VLTLTQDAADMIADLTHRADLPEGGLRIAHRGEQLGLTMEVAPAPDQEDIVLLQHDVAVFLDPEAADRLAGDTLDARRTATGSAFFLD